MVCETEIKKIAVVGLGRNGFVTHTCTCINMACFNSRTTHPVFPLCDYQSIISFKPLLGLRYDEIIVFPLPVLRKYYVRN